MLKRLRKRLPNSRLVLKLVVITAITLPFWWRLGTMVPGFSQQEVNAAAASSSLSAITNDLAYAPHKLLQLSVRHFLPSESFTPRLASVIFALILIACLYYILKRWFGRTIAVLASLIAASTPWLVIAGRSVSPEITLAFPVVLAALLLNLGKDENHKTISTAAAGAAAALCLYQPGGIWLVFLLLVVCRRVIKGAFAAVGKLNTSFVLTVFLVLISPLIWKVFSDINLAKNLLGLPQQLPAAFDLVKNFAWQLAAVTWRLPYHLDWTLGRLPILSVIQSVLVLFGAYAMYTLARPKAFFLFISLFIGLLLGAFNYDFSFTIVILVPIFVLMAAGLRYLYFQWRGVFPYNPIAKFLAVLVIVALSGLQMLYGLRYSLIAWPHQPSTTAAYHATIKE